MPDDNPIQAMDTIDLIGVRKDGGIDLGIVASGPLTSDAHVQESLLEKVEVYLGYINSSEFLEEFGTPSIDSTSIVIKSRQPVDPTIIDLVDRMKPWAQENNCTVRLEVKASS